jgi:hypothetical protein
VGNEIPLARARYLAFQIPADRLDA